MCVILCFLFIYLFIYFFCLDHIENQQVVEYVIQAK